MSVSPHVEDPARGGDYVAGGKPLTARGVALIFAAFVATFIGVNMVMLYFASSTFSGLVTTASFREGVKYDREIAAARAQDERGWKVDAQLSPVAGGRTRVEIHAVDREGRPLAGLVATATLSHPADARRDIAVPMRETATGIHVGESDPAMGAWTLVIELRRGGERLFLSRNRTKIGA